MQIKDYIKKDGIELAKMLEENTCTSDQLIHCASILMDQFKDYNFLTFDMRDRVDEQKIKSNPTSSTYLGLIPTLLKDLTQHYAGIPTASGSNAFKHYRPTVTSDFVDRMNRGGLLILGKTNVPEFGIKGTTESKAFGPTKNPWDKTKISGGSSGGSAVAVSLGVVPFAHGNDGGGSIRIPAAHCGLFGLKPSRGRTPVTPYFAEIIDGAVCDHFLTRSVRDSAFLLDMVKGPTLGSPFHISSPTKSYFKIIQEELPRLKIGLINRSPYGGEIHPDYLTCMQKSKQLLQDLGHEVIETSIQLDGAGIARNFLIHYSAANSYTYEFIKEEYGQSFAKKNTEIETQILCLLAKAYSAHDYVCAQNFRHDLHMIFANFFTKFDLFMCPTVASPPVNHGQHEIKFHERIFSNLILALSAKSILKATKIAEDIALSNLHKVPFTQLANLTGEPSMSTPLFFNEQGLPLGTMFQAPMGREDLLLQLAAELEQATNWRSNFPKVVGELL